LLYSFNRRAWPPDEPKLRISAQPEKRTCVSVRVRLVREAEPYNGCELIHLYISEIYMSDFNENDIPVEEAPAPKPLSRKKKRRIRNTVLPFFAALGLMTALAWCIPLRPDFSELEKRELQSFPEFSLSALFSGEWFSGVSLWFSDTFPGRESWVRAQSSFETLYGDRSITYSGALVTLEVTPEPTAEPTPQPTPDSSAVSEVTSEPTSEPTPEPTPDPASGVSFETGEVRKINSSIYFGDAAYELYGSNDQACQTFCNTMSRAADKYAGRYRFFSMICPNSGGILLSYDVYDELYGIRQDDAVNKFYEGASENLIPVKIYDTLRAHNSEYLFFRTDHHWTALGAYYAYTVFCEAAGFEPVPLSEYTELEMDPFLGSYYQHNPNKEMENNPDTIIAYVPPGDVSCTNYGLNGVPSESSVIVDMRGKTTERQYLCFLGGDHYLSEITNNDIQDDSAIIVVKDSYGNPFAGYLSQHYHTVLALDWHYDLRLNELMNKYNVKDILVLTELVQAQGSTMLNNLYGDFLTARGGAGA